jgi:predicted transcriptional regulator
MRRTAPISFRIKAEIKEALERLSEADKRSLSSYIELALQEHIERKAAAGGKAKKRV